MRILVVNRVDNPACANAMEMIPGAEVRVVDEENHDACAEAFTEFAPRVIVVSDPTDQEGIGNMCREDSGLIILYPRSSSVSMCKPPYSLFRGVNFNSGVGYSYGGITDPNELAVRVVENCVPEVSVFITDPDEFWQKAMEKDFSEIPGVMVFAQSAHVDDAMRKLTSDIVVIDWLNILSPNSIRRYAWNRTDLKIAVFSDVVPERDIIRQGPEVDFVLCKSAPIAALTLVVESWTKQIQARKRAELHIGLLRNQRQTSRSS